MLSARIWIAGVAGFWLAGCSPIPKPRPLPETTTFTGRWDSNWGQMELTQGAVRSGRASVYGRYKGFRNGSIVGVAKGDLLLFKWTQQENRQYGRGFLQMTPDGRSLEGRWGYHKDRSAGGRWWANRASD